MTPRGFTQVVTIAGPAKLVFISGQVAVDKEGKLVGPGDLKAQIRQAASNLKAALTAAGATRAAGLDDGGGDVAGSGRADGRDGSDRGGEVSEWERRTALNRLPHSPWDWISPRAVFKL